MWCSGKICPHLCPSYHVQLRNTCLLLVEQIRYLTEVGFFQSLERSSIVCHIRELSAGMVDQLDDMVFNQYIEFYPLQYIQDQLHSLVMDQKQSSMISNMTITSLLGYVKLLQNISHEKYEEPTLDALQPLPKSFFPSALTAVKPPPGFPVPAAAMGVKPTPGSSVPVETTSTTPHAIKPPTEFSSPATATVVKPSPGFSVQYLLQHLHPSHPLGSVSLLGWDNATTNQSNVRKTVNSQPKKKQVYSSSSKVDAKAKVNALK